MSKKSKTRKSKPSIKDLPLPAEKDVKGGGGDLRFLMDAMVAKDDAVLSNILNKSSQSASSVIQNLKG